MSHPLNRWPAPKTFDTPGDEIKGVIVAWDTSSEAYPIIHIREATGLVRIVRIQQARLRERLAELLPEQGDEIWIRYTGDAERAPKGLTKAKEFKVKVRRQGSQPPEDGTSATSLENAQEAGT